jgi:uncharacterized protein YrrD
MKDEKMLYRAKTLVGFKLHALDGEIGTVKEFYFDDLHWTIRYLIADTGDWLSGRKVLISPYALAGVRTEEKSITVQLTMKQIETCPSLDSDKPISRHYEDAYYGHYGWPLYSNGPYMWGPYPGIERDPLKWGGLVRSQKAWDPHLRSTHDVTGHAVQAKDGEIGHVDDFIIDDVTWTIRYLSVDTQNWLPGKKVLISPRWIEKVSWSQSKVFFNLLKETIQRTPEYTDETLITRDFETILHQKFHRPGYWVEEASEEKLPI